MRILVTGISGQIGQALSRQMQAVGTVIATDRQTLDLSRPETIEDTLDRLAPDVILNPAAYTAVDLAEDELELAYLINAEAPGHLAQWAAQRCVPLVHFSTDYVFDGSDGLCRENSAPNPLSVYGASKLAGELAVARANGACLIVRTSWIYAARGNNFLNTIVRLARERRELRIVGDQIGAPTSARVVARIVSSIIGKNLSHLPEKFARAGGIVNVACLGETSWHGFAVAVIEGLRARGAKFDVEAIHKIRTEDYSTRAKRPKNSLFDLRRLNEVFGITPPLWHEALGEELDAFVFAT